LCESVGLEALRDPSNEDPAFLRNRVRSELIPLLCQVAGRDLVPILARQSELLGEEADLLDSLAATVDPTDALALTGAPAPLARRAVRRWLRDATNGADGELHPPSAADVARVLTVAAGTATAC